MPAIPHYIRLPFNEAIVEQISADLRSIFINLPGCNVLVLPDVPRFTIVAVSTDYLDITGRQQEELIGNGLFEVFPNNPADPHLTGEKTVRASLEYALHHKEQHHLPMQRYDIADAEGQFEERYWKASNKPLTGQNGEVKYLIHSVIDVTAEVKAKETRESEHQVRSLVESAPFPIGVYIGREMRIAFLNQAIIDVWGKGPDVVGKTYMEVLPELKDQNIYPQLDRVYTTGIPFHAKNQRVDLVVDGKLQPFYFNYSFTPLFNEDGSVYGVLNTAAEVTDLVVAKQQVEQSEQNFRNIILQAPVAMCLLLGPDHVVDLANDAMIQLWGKPKETVMHKPIFDGLPDAKEQGLEKLLHDTYYNGQSFKAAERPVELIRKGRKEMVYQNFSYEPYRNADGEIVGVVAISVDVTEQVVARKKIEEAEQKARLAIESADLGTYEVDIKSGKITTSKRFVAIWGVGESAKRSDYANVIHADDLPTREKAMQEAMRTGNLDYEARIIPDGKKLKWVKVRGAILQNEDGEPERILGVVQDITEQKLFAEELKTQVKQQTKELLQAHQSLLTTNEYFQYIINRFDAALATLLPVFENGKLVDFRFKLTNDAYTPYAGLTPAELQNKRVGEVFPGYFSTDAFKRYASVYQTGQPQNWELHYNVDNLNVFLVVAASKLNDEVVVNFTDITTLKNLQLDLISKIEELEHSNQNLEDFAYAASHDLKEPIRKIHFFADRLKLELASTLSDSQRQLFARLENAALRMQTLIDDLLSYSQATKGISDEDEVDLNKKLRLVLNDLELQIEQTAATVNVDPLPTIKGNKRQIQQLFLNLISNALKYHKAGTPPHVSIHSKIVNGSSVRPELLGAAHNKRYHLIEVKDNGIGFEQKDAERIFNVFTRLHGKSEYGGTGVGLSIVRKVVENHHGIIWAESEPDKGASFFILLPVA